MQDISSDKNIFQAAEAFGFNNTAEIIPVNNGLINSTYKVSDGPKTIILQKINKNVFSQPMDIVNNYNKIYSYLDEKKSFLIPAPIKTIDNSNCFIDENMNYWRATSFIEDAYSPEIPQSAVEVYQAAYCFGNFTRALSEFDVSALKVIIPRFHDLAFRYEQFWEAMKNQSSGRKDKSSNEIDELIKRERLIDFYNTIVSSAGYRQRVMHHDAKLSNILFDLRTPKVICPIDFDTVQPGYFFSDIGDMIRSMACSLSENSVELGSIGINIEFYKAIIDGYMAAMQDEFTGEEKKRIHYAGLMMIYMQALRYMTDYLNGDIYYRIVYPEQNFDRARNQLTLLQRLEEFLVKEHSFSY